MNNRRILALLLMMMMIVCSMNLAVFADEPSSTLTPTTLSLTVDGVGGIDAYATLQEAVTAVEANKEGTVTITLACDITGSGVRIDSGFTDLTIDLSGYTYTIQRPTVGSSGTETNGFQLLKDSNITIKNGTITSMEAKILIQNYSNLTLDNVTLDGSELAGKYPWPYTLSNNNGDVTISGSSIIGSLKGFAFDVCDNSSYAGTTVTLINNSTVQGFIEVSDINGGDMNSKLVLKEDGEDYQTVTAAGFYRYDDYSGQIVSVAAVSLNFETNGGTEIEPITVPGGVMVDLLDYTTERSGYKFKGWHFDQALSNKIENSNMETPSAPDEPIIVYAKWAKNSTGKHNSNTDKYTVSFESNGGSEVTSVKVVKNASVSKPEDPTRSGYYFAGWYVDKALKTKYDFADKVTGDITLYAAWDKTNDAQSQFILTIGKYEANVFGIIKVNDVVPKIVNSRTMLPARFVVENLGATVEWDAVNRIVTITGKHLRTGEDVTIVIMIDSSTAYVNGNVVELDSPAFIENSRTYTPLRFIAENLGADVYWNAETQQVIITAKFN